MTLEELDLMIEKDLQLDKSELAREQLRTPSLHNKYNKILIDQKYQLRKRQTEYDEQYLKRWQFYRGKAPLLDYQNQEFERGTKVLEKDVPMYLNADPILKPFKDRLYDQKELVSFLERTLKEINQRGWAIKNIIESNKFDQGM
tara:strand:- start:1596 stop:2027 length:432 start_codon:yes stop_codon:yes gene_type:complete